MKAFFWSVLGAVVSAILIYFANDFLEGRAENQKFGVEYQLTNALIEIEKNQLTSLAERAGKYADKVRIGEVRITNTGSESISNQLATLRVGEISDLSGGVLKVETVKFPGDDPDGVVMKASKDRVDLTYKLFKPGEEHRFWFAYDSFGFPSFNMRGEGLALTEKTEYAEDDTWGIGSVLLAIIFLLGSFLAGAFASYSSTSAELKSRGQDLDALIKLPKLPT